MKRRQAVKKRARVPKKEIHRWVIRDLASLLAFPGVRSVSIGVKEQRQRLTAKVAVKIYVTEKGDRLTPLPKRVVVLVPGAGGVYRGRSIPTDVVEAPAWRRTVGAGEVFASVPVGAKLGIGKSSGPGAGSMACVVRGQDGADVILTAGHVLSKQSGDIPPTIVVFQPNSPVPQCLIGQVVKGFVGHHPDINSYMDAALVSVGNSRTATNVSWDPVNLPRVRRAMTNAEIRSAQVKSHKLGAQTGYTRALYSTFHDKLADPLGELCNVVEFTRDPADGADIAIADFGDSGSAVISRSAGSEDRLIGVLFAVSADLKRFLVVPFESIQALYGVIVAPAS